MSLFRLQALIGLQSYIYGVEYKVIATASLMLLIIISEDIQSSSTFGQATHELILGVLLTARRA